MKTLFICFIGALLFCTWLSASNTPASLPATLQWIVTTNWQDRGLAPMSFSVNVIEPLHYEQGTITSNLLASVVWNGRTHAIELESITIGTTARFYRIESKKVYSP